MPSLNPPALQMVHPKHLISGDTLVTCPDFRDRFILLTP